MPTWPTSLPSPLRPGWGEQAQSNSIAFKPEVGPPITRRRATVRTRIMSATFRLSGVEVGTFISFYEDDLKDGTLRFSMLHPVTGVSADWVFDEPWSHQAVDVDIYDMSVTLRMLP